MYSSLKNYFIGGIIRDKNILEAAKVRILFDMVLFAITLTTIIGTYTLYLGHVSISARAFFSIILIVGLLFATKKISSVNLLVHTLATLTAISVFTNIFWIIQAVDYSTIALFFVLIIFCFYFMSVRWATIYTLVLGICLIAVMVMNARDITWTEVPAEVITELEQALAFFVVLILVIYLLVQFHRANRAFSDHLTESNKLLRNAKESADEMSRLKTYFMANMSHEIRTPINGIVGLSELILDKSKDEEITKMAGMQLESSNRLLNTITSILKLSRMEAEQKNLELSRIDLNILTQSCIELLKPLAEKKQIELNFHSNMDCVYCLGTEDIMYQILNNIIGNGIKFTDHGKVDIYTEEAAETSTIIISDTGIGISTDFLPKIFNAFEQESAGLNREFEGSGLGLSISKKYIELLGGELEVDSEKGKGSKFTIILPAASKSVA